MADEKQMVHIQFDLDLLDRLDDFRFGHRFASRAAALKWLLDWALTQAPQPPPPRERQGGDD